ncbi:MAG: hypothetical protein QXP70_00580 [Methanomassiliicoccales archaeon]
MNINIEIRGGKIESKVMEVNEGARIIDIVRMLGVHPDGAVFFLNDEPVSTMERVSEGDSLLILIAASGGFN